MAFVRELLTFVALLPALSALQLERTGDGPLPSVGEFLEKPRQVFTAVGSDIATLRNRLSEAQQESQAEIEKQEAEYEGRLSAQKEENFALERANKGIAKEIQVLQHANKMLRKNASKLEKKNGVLTADLKILKANISYAQEFLGRALNESHSSLHESPDMEVLSELAQIEKEQDDALAQKLRYREIGGFEPTVLLQLTAGHVPSGVTAPGILEMLSQSLDELKQEQNASEVALKEAFEGQLGSLTEHHGALLDIQADLNITRSREAELHEQLVPAVDRLQATHTQLLERSRALRAFVQRVAARPLAPKPSRGTSVLQGQQVEA